MAVLRYPERMKATHTIFDRLIAGELPASFVYRDEVCVVFMDIHPITQGHALVVPLRSVPTLAELDAATRQHLWEVGQRIGAAQRRALGSDAQHFLVNDGKAASQTVPHVHLHVIPAYRGDTVRRLARLLWHIATLALPHREDPRLRARLDAQAQRIAAAL